MELAGVFDPFTLKLRLDLMYMINNKLVLLLLEGLALRLFNIHSKAKAYI